MAETAPLDRDRVEGLAKRVREAGSYEKAEWLLKEPVKNFSQSVVDETLKRNVEAQGKAGLRPRIVRKASGGCCPWCAALAGEYDYPAVPKDVYRRHLRCRCTTEYDPDYGRRRQDVWTKSWTSPEDRAIMEARKAAGLEEKEREKTPTRQFKNQEMLMGHFKKHGAEYGNISVQEYLRQATQLAEEPPSDDVVQLQRADNRLSKYRFSTNDFLVLSEDGTIRTFFKPKTGGKYWDNEIKKHG